ncbi:hypothetical protein BEWA_047130 [Theileria equi strain WA]|uniref:Signal peptide-containing protein n=1 Tax=Theileria equi strain WA TaxID=1537102 RepID=L1LAI2_THEEQ|nr:hypothetical protein BEWA_047130 [Theileria equi strain WA]EKX72249.1 hypothetical protein BEWA_047130 [Theileria equi strain WA]|eukprot:XP_004831701.1 hypothetical protein BEWA_047130 [Theileria equi strain WA]
MVITQIIILFISIFNNHVSARDCTVDILRPDSYFFNYFYYYYDDIPTRLIVPKENIHITSIKEGDKTIWNAGRGPKCFMLTIRLASDRPILLHISTLSQESSGYNLYKVAGEWRFDLIDTKEKATKALFEQRHIPKNRRIFTLDFFITKEDDQFAVMRFDIFKIPVRFHVPKLAHHATEVVYRRSSLWKATKKDEHCITVASHLKNLEPILICVVISDYNEITVLYFEKKDYFWRKLDPANFETRLKEAFDHVCRYAMEESRGLGDKLGGVEEMMDTS